MSRGLIAPGQPAELPLPIPDDFAPLGFRQPPEAADFCGVSEKYLAKLRRAGKGPPTYTPEWSKGLVLYDLQELCAWIRSFRANSTAEAAVKRQAAKGATCAR